MIVNADFKSLEVVCAFYLSQDPIGMKEWIEGLDFHADNRDKFNLGEGEAGRFIAKVFIFRILYGGSAFAFSKDPAFMPVSEDVEFWEDAISAFYRKYRGVHQWHTRLMDEAIRRGRVTLPTGRFFPFQKDPSATGNQPSWPRTKILNYPVQGFGADLVLLARVALARALIDFRDTCLFVSTVHDSIVWDCESHVVPKVCDRVLRVFEKLPRFYEKCFGGEFNLPLRAELSVGEDWGNLEKWKE